MSEFDFSSFLALISPGGGAAEETDDQQQTPTGTTRPPSHVPLRFAAARSKRLPRRMPRPSGFALRFVVRRCPGEGNGDWYRKECDVSVDVEEVPVIVRKSCAGRRLTFDESRRLECDIEALFQSGEEESLPQLLVRTVAHLNSDNAANSDLPYAKQIAVNNTFLCYALKSGDLRIISRISNARVLVKTQEDDITSVQFLGADANRLLIASMDRKISLLEVWDKDEEEIEFRVLMCARVDLNGPIRVAWGPNDEEVFVFSVQTWVVFVQWAKVVEGREEETQFDIKCEEGATNMARFLKFDAEVTFLRCRGNALIVGTSDGMLQIWNSTPDALALLFSDANPEIADPIIKLKVTDGIPVRHVEVFGDEIFKDGASADSFSFLTVNYSTDSDPNTILLKSWRCSKADGRPDFQACPIQLLNLSMEPLDECTSLSVDYSRRENLLLMAERHWTSMLAIRCTHEDDLRFECITKFPLVQEIVSMELSEKISGEEDGVENGIDVYCIQPMIVQQYILDPDLCLPEIVEDDVKPLDEAPPEPDPVHAEHEGPAVQAVVSQDSAFFASMIHESASHPDILPQLAAEAAAKPAEMPIPVPESDLELAIPCPPVLNAPPPDQLHHPDPETQLAPALPRTLSTSKSSTSGTPMSEAQQASGGLLSPSASLHSRNRSDRLDSGALTLDTGNPEPPSSVSQSVTAAAVHLLLASQAERTPDSRPEKVDSDSDEPGLVASERMEKEMLHLQNLSMMDSSALPLNPDLSDLVETLERSISNVKRMIQVLEHKLGRAFHSVNKRLDVNFQDTLSRLDSLQNPGNRGGHEDIDLRMREHATVAMQGMLDVVQSTIQTEIKNTLRAVVGGAIQRVFAEFLSRQLSGLLNRCVENAISASLSAAVNQGLQSNFRDSFSDSIVPAFESAVQNMFGQIQNAFSAGLNEHLAGQNPMLGSQTQSVLQNGISKLSDFGEVALTDISDLKSCVASLSGDVQSMKQDIQTLLAASSSQSLSTPGGLPPVARATPDVVISEIFTLLKDEDYESAFNKALSLSRIDVLNRIINFVDYGALFASEPCPLSQSVLLSLLNQIGCDLVTDTETKLEWIRGAVTHLESAPASPRVGTLTMGVLDYLINKTQSMIKMGQISGPCVVSAKMTLNMLIGARNMSVAP